MSHLAAVISVLEVKNENTFRVLLCVTRTGDSDSAVKHCTEGANFLKTAGSISLSTGENPVSYQVITMF